MLGEDTTTASSNAVSSTVPTTVVTTTTTTTTQYTTSPKSNIGQGDTEFEVDDVSPFSVGDKLTFTKNDDDTHTETKTVVEIKTNNGRRRATGGTIVVNEPFGLDHDAATTTIAVEKADQTTVSNNNKKKHKSDTDNEDEVVVVAAIVGGLLAFSVLAYGFISCASSNNAKPKQLYTSLLGIQRK